MSTTDSVFSEESDTPKTDAAAFNVDAGAPEVESSRMEEVVTADFARAQERRIAELQTAIRNITCRLLPSAHSIDMHFTRIDIQHMEALLK